MSKKGLKIAKKTAKQLEDAKKQLKTGRNSRKQLKQQEIYENSRKMFFRLFYPALDFL